MCSCVAICCKLLFAVHSIFSETFGEGVGVDLQLCDLKIKTVLCEFSVYIKILWVYGF